MLGIKQFFVDEEKLKAKMAAKQANNANGKGKKSKFQERLENLQKAQQDKLKGKK
jgi:YidC/Oxa1 family membrane protein insertase